MSRLTKTFCLQIIQLKRYTLLLSGKGTTTTSGWDDCVCIVGGGTSPLRPCGQSKELLAASRSRYEGPQYEIVFPRKLTLDFVSIFAQDDFIFFGFFFVCFFFF